jgi:8-oxo-dGTP diphosphatase
MQMSEWSGRQAAALQAALRLTHEAFASKLGIATRTVAGWNADPNITPRSDMQQILDTVLEKASATERSRFQHLLKEPITPLAKEAQALRAAIAVITHQSEVLLVCRRSEDASSLRWQFPAGIVKPGAHPARTAERETLAETGIRCTTRTHLGSRLHPITRVMCDYYLCEYLSGEAANLDPVENADVTWAPFERLTSFIPAQTIYPPILEALEGQAI